MTSQPGSLGLTIPLFNEEKNVEELVYQFEKSGFLKAGLTELVLINNGSVDKTGSIIDALAQKFDWIRPFHLPKNINYGGAINYGLRQCRTEFVGFLPGDLQVSSHDVLKVWRSLQEAVTKSEGNQILAKGMRTERQDGVSLAFVSWAYSRLVNMLLNLKVHDINALPKIFHRSLLDVLPIEMDLTFFFDVQVLTFARLADWNIKEIPVEFLARRHGISSWSGKRVKVYRQTFGKLISFRKEIRNRRAA